MPEFNYIAKTLTGDRSEGVLSAATRKEALQKLKKQSLFPIRVTDVKPETLQLPASWKFQRKVKSEVVADVCTQMADLLNNGVPLLETLSILADATVHPQLKESLVQVRDDVSEGANLDDALSRHPHVFSELTISMVRAGLEGAFLEDALERVSAFLRKQDELRAKIIGSLTYPAILGIVGTTITALLIVFMVPKFQPFFDRLEANGGGLPVVTILLLAMSHFMMRYGVLGVLGAIFGFVALKRAMQTPTGRRMTDRVKLKLPLLGSIFHDAAVSRFCRVLGTLLRNGVPILKSLQISSQSSGNTLLEEVIKDSADNVTSGNTLATPLAASGLIPAQVMAMIRVAEESNSLDQVLVKIADRMDQQTERRLDVMVRMIEPLMLVFIGGMVMFVIVGVLLPVFDLNSTVG